MFQIGAACYSTPKQAALVWSTMQPIQSHAVASGCIATVRPVITGDEDVPVIQWTWTKVSGSCIVPPTVQQVFSPTPCALVDWPEASELAWGVVAAWLFAWMLRKYFVRASGTR